MEANQRPLSPSLGFQFGSLVLPPSPPPRSAELEAPPFHLFPISPQQWVFLLLEVKEVFCMALSVGWFLLTVLLDRVKTPQGSLRPGVVQEKVSAWCWLCPGPLCWGCCGAADSF